MIVYKYTRLINDQYRKPYAVSYWVITLHKDSKLMISKLLRCLPSNYVTRVICDTSNTWHEWYVTRVIRDTSDMSHEWYVTWVIRDTSNMWHGWYVTRVICHTSDTWHEQYVTRVIRDTSDTWHGWHVIRVIYIHKHALNVRSLQQYVRMWSSKL